FVNSAPSWRLIDPFGNLVLSDKFARDQACVRLPASGTYVLLVEGRRNETAVAPTVTFAGRTVVNQTSAINVGDIVSGSIDTPGRSEERRVGNEGTARRQLDSLTNDSGFTWTLSETA